ncbi:2-dehydropantoate 2-reductase (Ketopantoate reductase) (KPA reductase) (KPR) [Elasticomyces elasticus]|nr:2-dehydropantoate 2-reductase (Ketopantoate reductase) (KPA reductase) (KPR) [Elasticomyces elasticus]
MPSSESTRESSESPSRHSGSSDTQPRSSDQYRTRPDIPRRVHILGTGSVGKLVAHALRTLPNPPPVTLILHRRELYRRWQASDKTITVQTDDCEDKQDGFDVELAVPPRREYSQSVLEGAQSVHSLQSEAETGSKPHEQARSRHESSSDLSVTDQGPFESSNSGIVAEEDPSTMSEPIHNLILTVKAPSTISALSSIRHRLGPSSTICFLQNGMGILDEVNQKLFTDLATRPNYMQGIVTHGAHQVRGNDFGVVHAGHGTLALGLLPRELASPTPNEPSQPWAPSSRFLLRTLTRSPILCAAGFAPTELLQLQLEKLAVNAVINPLTVLLDARNGSLLYNFALTRTMRLLLAEISLVIRSLPELRGLPNVAQRFSPERLETLCISVADRTKGNISSMLADVRAGRKTEVEYISGYVVRRGEEMGMKCVVNYAVMQMVVGKQQMVDRERQGEVPVLREGREKL